MITGSEYRQRLNKMRRNTYMDGELIGRDDSRLEGAVNVIAKTYDMPTDPEFKEYEDVMTATSHLTGEKVNRFCHLHQGPTDLLAKQKMIRVYCHQVGGCIIRCMGMDATTANDVVSSEADQKYGTEYHKRFMKWFKDFQDNDRTASCAQTDVKGDRSQRPHQQLDPDLYVHKVETLSDGIVIRGAKVNNSGAPLEEWIEVIPTRMLTKEEGDWAISCVIPSDADGVKQVLSGSKFNKFQNLGEPGPYGKVHSTTIFDNVFVPWEHVFLNGEYELGGRLGLLFALFHRHSYTGCKPALIDVLLGAAALMAECNGIEGKGHVGDKLAEMISVSELCYGTGIAAAINATKSASGTYIPDILYSNVSRRHAGLHVFRGYEIVADIAGGLPASIPLEGDWENKELRPFLDKYIMRNPKVSAENQHRAFRWVEDMALSSAAGQNMYGQLHGGGSPRMEQIAILGGYDMERTKNIAKRLAGIPVDEKYTFNRLGTIPNL